MTPAEENLIKIQEKIFQVLRIKKQLESRRESLIQQLSSTNDQKQILDIISSLEHNYKREEKVIKICEKGLIAALEILTEVGAEISSSEGFFQRIKSKSLSSIPIIGKRFNGPESLMILLKLLYSYIKDQIVYIEKNLQKIKWNIKRQYKWILVLSIRIERGDVVGNISESKYFENIKKFHQAELSIIKEIEENSKAKKGDIYKILNQINIKLNQHQNFLKAQGLLIAAPTPTLFGAAGSLFLGPEVFGLFFGIGLVVSYSPGLAILGFYGSKYLFNKIPLNKIPIKDMARWTQAINVLATKKPVFRYTT